jgi:hypothetical protein
MSPIEMKKLIDVLAQSAPVLREAGVTSVAIHGVQATFAPHYPAAAEPTETVSAADDDSLDNIVTPGWVHPDDVVFPDDYDPDAPADN